MLAWAYPKDYPNVEPLEPPPGWTGWDVVQWRGPRNITVDRGRDGKLYLAMMQGGLMTREEWWISQGEDPAEAEKQVLDGISRRRSDWLAEGLPEDMFWRQEYGQGLPAAVQSAEEPPPAPAPQPAGN
jgi:capsid protein